MKIIKYLALAILAPFMLAGQQSSYTISFPDAVHHEALINASFQGITSDSVEISMSRSSPGRYALHEFVKNVYGFSAKDGKGNELEIIKPDPYSWRVANHDGTVEITYLLYADRGDGTYSQIDETHAHLNMPATFIYAPELQDRPFQLHIIPREDLGWNVATQLKEQDANTWFAPDLQYFMDSPIEISNFSLREFKVDSAGREYQIQFVLHHGGSEASLDDYFEKVKKIVLEEKEVFGELPEFDYGRYTFLACYLPHVSGDGMEHRNSTVLTSSRPLEAGGMDSNISTVSHEFFHAWNVERLRPASLQPFDFSKANMSGALWFAEGFTSYYTNLILCRSGIISPEKYVTGLTATFNYVWNSPALQYFDPIGMSFQAPFVDAATSVDPVNRENTFVSYYSYGSVLGLALDLALRQKGLSLDGYMKLLWQAYGKQEDAYTIEELHSQLNSYAGDDFGNHFFNTYIYNSGMPNYTTLFEEVGVVLSRDSTRGWLGISLSPDKDGKFVIQNNPVKGSPAYKAGLAKGDVLLALNGTGLSDGLPPIQANDTLQLKYQRRGKEGLATIIAAPDPSYSIDLLENTGATPDAETIKARNAWLGLE